ncbi:MAG: hypothetical protein ABIA93_02505 [Candidatus Woesearchaeota archaeon]
MERAPVTDLTLALLSQGYNWYLPEGTQGQPAILSKSTNKRGVYLMMSPNDGTSIMQIGFWDAEPKTDVIQFGNMLLVHVPVHGTDGTYSGLAAAVAEADTICTDKSDADALTTALRAFKI